MNNKYTQAPLPFQGQKRRFLTEFKSHLKHFKPHATYIDLFGGSGLLAHTVKQHYPTATVVWNDFDNYSQRITAIPQTNALLETIRLLLVDNPEDKRIEQPLHNQLLKAVQDHEKQHGYLDYITLSASLLFSGKYATTFTEFAKCCFYNRVKKNNYTANGYLQGVERVRYDYKQLYQLTQTRPNVVYLVDPPYLSTDTSSYNNDSYWKLRDYLDVLNVLEGSNYFYFTSNKSQIVELCDWIETRTLKGNPFAGSTTTTVGGSVNYASSYTDIMLVKYNVKSLD